MRKRDLRDPRRIQRQLENAAEDIAVIGGRGGQATLRALVSLSRRHGTNWSSVSRALVHAWGGEEAFEGKLQQALEQLDQRHDRDSDQGDKLATLDVVPAIIHLSEEMWHRMALEITQRGWSPRDIQPRQFEELVAFLFHEFGFEVELIKRTRDGGRDIVAVCSRPVGVRYLIECKHPVTGAKVGIAPVRELLGVKVDERATKAILATTSHFTREAALFLERHRWELEGRDHEGLLEWVEMYKGMVAAQQPNRRMQPTAAGVTRRRRG